MSKAIREAVRVTGSQKNLAGAIGVSPGTIWAWISRGTTPDAIYCAAIELATKRAVTRRDLRPDDWHLIWPELAEKSGGGE